MTLHKKKRFDSVWLNQRKKNFWSHFFATHTTAERRGGVGTSVMVSMTSTVDRQWRHWRMEEPVNRASELGSPLVLVLTGPS